MPIRISPHHTAEEFSEHWTFDDKIAVFIDRVQGWNLGVARDIVRSDIQNRDFALLHIVASFFEMMSKYVTGFAGNGASKTHFRKGVRLVFPTISDRETALLDSLYAGVRNGLYHAGRPGPNVIIDRDQRGSIGYNETDDFIKISPDQLVEDLWLRFEDYAAELRDPTKSQLRHNFERRFDSDNKLTPPAKK